jgi:hypothetical protein
MLVEKNQQRNKALQLKKKKVNFFCFNFGDAWQQQAQKSKIWPVASEKKEFLRA